MMLGFGERPLNCNSPVKYKQACRKQLFKKLFQETYYFVKFGGNFGMLWEIGKQFCMVVILFGFYSSELLKCRIDCQRI